MANKTDDLSGMTGEGVARKKIASLDSAIDEWRKIVKRRMALTESEAEAKAKVYEVMHKYGLETYLYTDDGDVEKECVLVESVKLRKIKTDDDDE